MREITQDEMQQVNGGLTSLEITMMTTLAGSSIGAVVGAIFMTGNAVGDYAFIGNVLGTAMGWISGGALGTLFGIGLGLLLAAHYASS